MDPIRAATWNVNSIRAREERLLAWLERQKPDVACLQETKVTDDIFPVEMLAEAGFFAAFHGQKTYNGVAILAKSQPQNVVCGLPGDPDDHQARLIAADVEGIRYINVYVPNGKAVGTDKHAYKLSWLSRLRSFVEKEVAGGGPLVLCGDFNIAPTDGDAAYPERWADSVLCHSTVRDEWDSLIGLGLHDAIRKHHEEPGPLSWWDYRRLAFPKGDGLRIDHHLLTQAAIDRCSGAEVDRNERKGKQASDHAPVFISLDR